MQKIILYISMALLTLVNSVVAQEKTFEQKAKEIAIQIKTIAEEEKRALKAEVEALDKAVELGKMTKEEAANSKSKIAVERAKNIETKIAEQEKALRDLVNAIPYAAIQRGLLTVDKKGKKNNKQITLGEISVKVKDVLDTVGIMPLFNINERV